MTELKTKHKKYHYVLAEQNGVWSVQIVRQVSSKKTVVSSQQGDFTSETDAINWAEARLAEFVLTQNSSNQRHGEQRKVQAEVRRQRSARRAEKIAAAKQAKEAVGDSTVQEFD